MLLNVRYLQRMSNLFQPRTELSGNESFSEEILQLPLGVWKLPTKFNKEFTVFLKTTSKAH